MRFFKLSFFNNSKKAFIKWSHKINLTRKLVWLLIAAGLACGTATYYTFSNTGLLETSSRSIVLLLNVDLVILLLFIIMIARRLVHLWGQRRQKRAGSKLHARLALIFGALTVTPTVFISITSGYLFNVGIGSWFNERISTAFQESTAVAEAYLSEHKKVITANCDAMAHALAENFQSLLNDQAHFNQLLDIELQVRSLDEAIVFNTHPEVLARSRLSFSLEFEPISVIDLERAEKSVVIIESQSGDRVRAFTKLPGYNAYLLVGRLVDPVVLKRIENAKNAVSEYNQLQNIQKQLEIRFVLAFILISLILLVIAIWVGLNIANQLARPIMDLIEAAEKVATGNFRVKVSSGRQEDELSVLAQTFNRMTYQLQAQQQELLEANQQIDQRRQFIEDVLAGVSAGVIELSSRGIIRLFNRSALELLRLNDQEILGQNLQQKVPEMAHILGQAKESKTNFYQAELNLTREGFSRVLLVRVVFEKGQAPQQGIIVTFDDITALVFAQRKAAWTDVARRIAHEIKNPLTPIQLSAERLRRKYLPLLQSDAQIFETCIETIIRQVDHIGRMVAEFSDFARMPAPQIVLSNLIELCQQAIFLQHSAHPDIKFEFSSTYKYIGIHADASQIGQVLTNLMQNAIDSIATWQNETKEKPAVGWIGLKIILDDKKLILLIEDNGRGFPENKASLTEPYVTYREKGTGLGLAIVKKIIEDHGGEISLEDRNVRGACVRITLPPKILEKVVTGSSTPLNIS